MLTDTRIKTAKPQAKLYKLTDERGLHLSVYPNGSKLWQMRYRIEGKERTASLGKYPEVSLAEARDKRDQLRKLIANRPTYQNHAAFLYHIFAIFYRTAQSCLRLRHDHHHPTHPAPQNWLVLR